MRLTVSRSQSSLRDEMQVLGGCDPALKWLVITHIIFMKRELV